jgi:competence ComEA-like helix-hairpin-helix protein
VKSESLLIPTAFILFAVSIGASSARAPQKPPVVADAALMAKSVGDMTADEEQAFSDAAEATIERVCISCHPFENIIRTRRTMREWDDLVATMKGRGAPGTDPDFAAIKKYLIRWYGVVPVNTATAEELTSVLGLSAREANAVVEHRNAHGTFADLASLEEVDGINKGKLEEQPDALRFN